MSVGGGRRLTSYDVFYIGRYISYLKRSRPKDRVVYDDGSIERDGRGFILFVMKGLYNLLVKHDLARMERKALQSLIRKFEERYGPSNYYLSNEDYSRLSRVIERLDAVLTKEISDRNFSESRPATGLLDYSKLLAEGVSAFFDEEVRRRLPEIVVHDLQESITCLAYGASTAAVMISLRAVEGMLREVCARMGVDVSRKNWYGLLESLKSELEGRGRRDVELLGYLDYLRNVRNQADHPDKVFTQREAEDTVMHAQYAVRHLALLME